MLFRPLLCRSGNPSAFVRTMSLAAPITPGLIIICQIASRIVTRKAASPTPVTASELGLPVR
jgi:hypothetical protein